MRTRLLRKLRKEAGENWRVREETFLGRQTYYVEEYWNYGWHVNRQCDDKKDAITFCKDKIERKAMANFILLKFYGISRKPKPKNKIIFP